MERELVMSPRAFLMHLIALSSSRHQKDIKSTAVVWLIMVGYYSVFKLRASLIKYVYRDATSFNSNGEDCEEEKEWVGTEAQLSFEILLQSERFYFRHVNFQLEEIQA